MFIPQDPYLYTDWGTLEQYLDNIKSLDFINPGILEKYLISHEFIIKERVGTRSYHSNQRNVYNFTGRDIEKNCDPGVYLNDGNNKLAKILF